MTIDWFTFAAQIVNFLILVGLLRYFLYGPIVRAMQERERKAAQRLADADSAKSAVEQERQVLQKQTEDIEQQRNALLSQAKADADEQRQQWLNEARQEAEGRRQQWMEAFERDRLDLTDKTRHQIGRMGFEAARQILRQLADADLHSQICRLLIQRLKSLDERQRSEVEKQLADSGAAVLVRSALQLNDDDRAKMGAAIREAFHGDHELRFETDEALVCGLEIDAGGYSLRWNADIALKEMEA